MSSCSSIDKYYEKYEKVDGGWSSYQYYERLDLAVLRHGASNSILPKNQAKKLLRKDKNKYNGKVLMVGVRDAYITQNGVKDNFPVYCILLIRGDSSQKEEYKNCYTSDTLIKGNRYTFLVDTASQLSNKSPHYFKFNAIREVEKLKQNLQSVPDSSMIDFDLFKYY